MKLVEHDIHRSVVGADRVLHDRLAGNRDRVSDAGDAPAFSVAVAAFRVAIVMCPCTASDFLHLGHDRLRPFQRR